MCLSAFDPAAIFNPGMPKSLSFLGKESCGFSVAKRVAPALRRRGRMLALAVGLGLTASVGQAGPSGPVTWGATVNVTGGGWGRMIPLTNGQWLCVSTLFPPGTNSYLGIYRSGDACRTWHLLADVREDGRTLDNGELVALPNGDVLLTMRSLIHGSSYRLPVYRSLDHGAQWTYLSTIDASENAGTRGLWEPDFWVLADGRLIVTYSNEKHQIGWPSYSQIISARVSSDHGASWGPEIRVVTQPGGGGLRPGMSQMTRMVNGQYLLVYEVVGLGNADVYAKSSADGVTWPRGLGTRIPGHHGGPFVTALPDGRVFITSCENQVSFSEDFGETWQKLDPPAWHLGFHFSWPALYATQTNELAVMVVAPNVKLRFGALAPPKIWPDLFTENFDDSTDLDWTRYGANFAFDNGRYELNNLGTYGKALVGDNFWTDGILEADVRLQTASGDGGLLMRATNPDDLGPDDLYGYYVGLRAGGAVFLGKMSYSWKEIATAAMPIATNTWYHLKIVLTGPQLAIYVDDMTTPKIIHTDTTHRRGQIGVRSFQANAQFDNVIFRNTAPWRLRLRRQKDQLHFSWRQNAHQRQLASSPDPTTPASWQLITNTPTLTDGEWSLSLPLPSLPQQFFRLQPQ